eukprot:scaffold194381_cov17-Tisochrysis_lutea.AAC.2
MQRKSPSRSQLTYPASANPSRTDPLTCKTNCKQEVASAAHEDGTRKLSALVGYSFGGYYAYWRAEPQKSLQICLKKRKKKHTEISIQIQAVKYSRIHTQASKGTLISIEQSGRC